VLAHFCFFFSRFVGLDSKMMIGNTWNYRLKHNDASNCSFWRNISDSNRNRMSFFCGFVLCDFPPLTRNSQVNSTDSVRFKNNFCRVGNHSYFGSPADGVLSPWSTSLYGFFDKNMSYIPMESQAVFQDDLFGLQTMFDAGRLGRTEVAGVFHTDWLFQQNVFETYVLPLLN
jgi:hypothetical protein